MSAHPKDPIMRPREGGLQRTMREEAWGVWVTSACDRDSDDGWLWVNGRPWTGSEAEAIARAETLSHDEARARFGHEARKVHS